MQPVRLVIATNDGSIPAALVARFEGSNLAADEHVAVRGTNTRGLDDHSRADSHARLGEDIVLRVIADHREHVGKMDVVFDDHTGEPGAQVVREGIALDLNTGPARQGIGRNHRAPPECGSGGISRAVPGVIRSGSSAAFTSASTLQRPGLPYSAYATEWSVSPAENVWTRRPEIPPEVGLVPGMWSGFSVIDMVASARTGRPSTPNCL